MHSTDRRAGDADLKQDVTARLLLASQLSSRAGEWFSGRSCHPEPDAIERIAQLLQSVLLPNYFPAPTGAGAVEQLYDALTAQIHRAVFARCIEREGTPETRSTAETRTDTLFDHLPGLQEALHHDVLAMYDGDPAASGLDEIILTYPGLLALMVYRMAHILYGMGIPLLPRMMTEYAHRVTGIDIHPGARIGKSILIDHGTGIVIGETAVVGDRVKLYQGVTLGALYFPRDETGLLVRKTKRHPTVEDDVVLYAHATVLGGGTVLGRGSVVGSNAWITESVPPYSKVLYQSMTVTVPRPGSDVQENIAQRT